MNGKNNMLAYTTEGGWQHRQCMYMDEVGLVRVAIS